MILLAQFMISVDVVYEITEGTNALSDLVEQKLSTRKFFVKLCIGMVIYAPIAKGMNDKCKTFVEVIEMETGKFWKFIFLSLLWFQMV